MEHAYTALRYSKWALEFIIIPPVCFAFPLAAISLVWAGFKQRPLQTHLWKPYHWLVLTHVLFFVAAIVVGVLWPNPNPTIAGDSNRFATMCLDAVAYGSLASCAFWVWSMKGFRWYATSLMVLAELITWGALFIAGMSVSGDWL